MQIDATDKSELDSWHHQPQPPRSSMNNEDPRHQQHEYHQQSVLTMQKSVTITQRSTSMDYLNFEEKRQLIASSLSLSDILQVGPAVAAQAAKDVAANTVLGTKSIQSVKNSRTSLSCSDSS